MPKMDLVDLLLMQGLVEGFQETADWRRRKAKEHPEDRRNQDAADELERLIDTAADVDPDLLLAFDELFSEEMDSERHDEMLRAIGFSASYDTATDFVKAYIAAST